MEEEMKIISKKYPNSTFTVYRIGEESFIDMYQYVFKNGKMLSKKECELKPIK